MTEWKYKVVTINTLRSPTTLDWIHGDDCGSEWIKAMLDSMGSDGWQLVALVPARPADYIWKHPVSGAESMIAANPWLYNAIFKKPAETVEERKQRVESERLARRIEEHKSDQK